ncbi:DUF952-domain-containing protein [Polychaeton citri CBS 116435]|uniref:DUF952-domain-containing protein n=1 Tax=Polychaeton citri CBS 116435 TaxID=1314669 RepID=A0A9P4USU9_9PEZI|nr:DUF952-domain-containing protein [Polychaeton citri CBS 116435]
MSEAKSHPTIAYKILNAPQWSAWQKTGTFSGASIDLTDGYIHLSTATQGAETYAKFFKGQQDLVVAEIDLDDLTDSLKWEPSRNNELFPHVYGEIKMESVDRVWDGDNVNEILFARLAQEQNL